VTSVKMKVITPARAMWAANDELITERSVLRLLDGVKAFGDDDDPGMAVHLDEDMIDAGIVGGDVGFSYSFPSGLRVNAVFWAPVRLAPLLLERLIVFTLSQWSDGAGEGGFDVSTEAGKLIVLADESRENARLLEQEDAREVPMPSKVAICAREGDQTGLLAALNAGEAVDGVLAGYRALHLAITCGHVEIVRCLVNRGADVNAATWLGDSPLHLCAVANALSDEDSARIARVLLERGARSDAIDRGRHTVAELAEIRDKPLLRALVKGSGARP